MARAFLALVLFGSACRAAPVEPAPFTEHREPRVRIEVLSGAVQAVLPGRRAPEPLVVRAVDEEGRPVEGIQVAFYAPDVREADAGSTLAHPDFRSSSTDGDGIMGVIYVGGEAYPLRVIAHAVNAGTDEIGEFHFTRAPDPPPPVPSGEPPCRAGFVRYAFEVDEYGFQRRDSEDRPIRAADGTGRPLFEAATSIRDTAVFGRSGPRAALPEEVFFIEVRFADGPGVEPVAVLSSLDISGEPGYVEGAYAPSEVVVGLDRQYLDDATGMHVFRSGGIVFTAFVTQYGEDPPILPEDDRGNPVVPSGEVLIQGFHQGRFSIDVRGFDELDEEIPRASDRFP